MADKPKDKGGKKPAPSLKKPTDVLIGIVTVLFCITLVFGFLQNKFSGGAQFRPEVWIRNSLFSFSSKVRDYTPEGTRVVTSKKANVWESSLRERILGIQKKGSVGIILEEATVYGTDVLLNIDFESDPDGWVYNHELKKQVSGWMGTARSIFLWLSAIITLLGAWLMFYSWKQWRLITKNHREHMRELEKKLVGDDISSHNERWDRVEKLIASENPGDWRIAILEADVMLDELVASMGYGGQSLGDRLKAIEKSDFATLDDAWEAHKIRNRIAHSGTDFILTHREAKRVVALFEQVFREFDYI